MERNSSGIKLTPRPGQGELAWYEWLLVLGVVAAAVVACAMGGRAMLRSEGKGAEVIVELPTATRPPTRTPLPTYTSTPTPTLTPTPPGTTAVDGFVEVYDAGPQGLSFRAGAGLGEQRLKYLSDGAVMRVIDGPVESDGLKWWRLQNPDDPNEVGWSAADYLRPANPPQ
ncbi:MAG: SH3 domain-containing protein [Thermoflexales bacterium]|nr:SH3 domain-containing protein [Thermoflexales bacterium]